MSMEKRKAYLIDFFVAAIVEVVAVVDFLTGFALSESVEEVV